MNIDQLSYDAEEAYPLSHFAPLFIQTQEEIQDPCECGELCCNMGETCKACREAA